MRGTRLAAFCAVAGLLLLAVVVARGSSAVPSAPRDIEIGWEPPSRPVDVEQGDETAAPVDLTEVAERPDRVRDGSLVVVLVLVLAAVLVLVLQLTRSRRRKVWEGLAVEEDLAHGTALPNRLRRAAEQARTDLAARAGGPPGDAVVAAWLTLEQAAAEEGAGRLPHQTPTEFTVALLGRHTTDEAALDELRALYQRARFGRPGEVGAADVQHAMDALDRVLHAFGETATA